MGDAGKVCFSKASSTAGRVAHKATNGRVIYKRATNTKHATIKIDFAGTVGFTPGARAQWGRSQNSIIVGAGYSSPYYPDYESAGLHYSWVDGVVEYIEGSSPSAKSLQFRAWLSEYRSYGEMLYIRTSAFNPEGVESSYIDVTVQEDGVTAFSGRYNIVTGVTFVEFAVGFDSSGKVDRLYSPNDITELG